MTWKSKAQSAASSAVCSSTPRVAAQPGGHLGARAQVTAAGGGQPAVHLIEAEASPDRGQRLRQPGILRRGVMHVAGGDHADAGRGRQRRQRVIALVVGRVVANGQLDLHVVRAERLRQPGKLARGRVRPISRQRRGDRALAAAGEDYPVPVVRVSERGLVVDRQALLTAG